MSRAARKWASAQAIDDRSLSTMLSTLAGLADAKGCIQSPQDEIARSASMSDRSVRSALNLLEAFGVIFRQSRGSRKGGGRASDHISLAIDHSFSISQDEVRDARISGYTTGSYRKHGSGYTSDSYRKGFPVTCFTPGSRNAGSLYKEHARAR